MHLIVSKQREMAHYHGQEKNLSYNKKAPLQGLLGGLWQIRTVDLFRVKEAL